MHWWNRKIRMYRIYFIYVSYMHLRLQGEENFSFHFYVIVPLFPLFPIFSFFLYFHFSPLFPFYFFFTFFFDSFSLYGLNRDNWDWKEMSCNILCSAVQKFQIQQRIQGECHDYREQGSSFRERTVMKRGLSIVNQWSR